MNLYKIIILFAVFNMYGLLMASSDPDSTIVFNNTCPFECCQFGEWVIEGPINVYKNEGDTNSFVFELNFKDTIFAKTGNLHFIQVGKVVVYKQIYDFHPNDTLIVYNCKEGEYIASHESKQYYVDVFWPMFFSDEEDTEENYLQAISQREYSGKMIQTPKTVWWVKIESSKGEGWLRLENKTPYCFRIDEKIKGMDGCG
jgi:hypothetical protein